MGNMKPNSSAALRAIKAEGGWGVVCTEYCSIHPSSDETPFAYLSLWDDEDMQPAGRLPVRPFTDMARWPASNCGTAASHANNRGTREVALAP